MLAIIAAAAEAYRGVVPADCWHDPYMPETQLRAEIAAGVVFWGIDRDGALAGIMGLQAVRDVDLIRHAYVVPAHQGHGIGGALLEYFQTIETRPLLVGTWAAAAWAIRFYERYGFERASPADTAALLGSYWTISPRQVETSVVLRGRSVPPG